MMSIMTAIPELLGMQDQVVMERVSLHANVSKQTVDPIVMIISETDCSALSRISPGGADTYRQYDDLAEHSGYLEEPFDCPT